MTLIFFSLSSAELHWNVSFWLFAEWVVIVHPVGAVTPLVGGHILFLFYPTPWAVPSEWAVQVIGHFLWNA